jgi:hypothetical protein
MKYIFVLLYQAEILIRSQMDIWPSKMSNLLTSDEWRTCYVSESGLIPAKGRKSFGFPPSRSEEHSGDIERALLLTFLGRFS